MWSSAALTALSSGLHSCLSKSDWSCCLALSASTRNSRRVLKTNLQTSQYAVLGVLPMNRAILRFRSGIATSLQGTITESNAFLGSAVAIDHQPFRIIVSVVATSSTTAQFSVGDERSPGITSDAIGKSPASRRAAEREDGCSTETVEDPVDKNHTAD
jgi:hypothetical protein